MTTTFVTITLALAIGSTGQQDQPDCCPPPFNPHAHHGHDPIFKRSGGWVLPPGPGDGWGFPNANPDAYGWYNWQPLLPLGADRTAEYFFPRYHAAPPEQMFMGTYYNPYVNRGQRYVPYAGSGGCHPMGGPPSDTAETPIRPYSSLSNSQPVATIPRLRGRV